MIKAGKLKTKTSVDIGKSNFAIHYCEANGGDSELSIKRLSESGVKWVRYYFETVWSRIETEKGKYDFTTTDYHIGLFEKYKIKPYIQLGGGNYFYTEGLTGHQPCISKEAFEGFLGYVDAIVSHYKDRVFHWELWNEINLLNFWKPKVNISEYADLLVEVAKIIRKHQGDKATIIAASFSGVHADVVEEFMQTKATGCYDVLGIHPYFSHPETMIAEIKKVQAIVEKYDKNVVLWNTECGYASGGDTIHGRTLSPWGYRAQAKWALRRAFVDFMEKFEMSTYFMLTDIVYTQEQYDKKIIQVDDSKPIWHYVGKNTKGLIDYYTAEPKKAFYAIANMNTILDNAQTPTDLVPEFKVTDEGCFIGAGKTPREFLNPYYLAYTNASSETTLLFYLPWPIQEVIEEGKVTVSVDKGAFKTPVLVDLLTAEVYEAEYKTEGDKLVFENLPLVDYPMALVEKSSIETL